MKHLLLLRHAKSDWDESGLPDIERLLAPRGERDALRIGEALYTNEPLPDLILSSTALRARQTIAAVIQSAPHSSIEPRFLPSIYAASSTELMEVVRELRAACKCALLVGHNPGFEELLARLTGKSEPMPTAALAYIALDIPRWEEVTDGKGQLARFLTPRSLKDGGG